MSKNIQVNDNFCDHCRKDMPTDDLEVLPWKPDYGWFVEEQLADKDDVADYDERPEGFQMYLCKDCIKEFHQQKKERAIREKQNKEETRQALITLIKNTVRRGSYHDASSRR
jgi:hypothetical protein